jgi:hypothetical protein
MTQKRAISEIVGRAEFAGKDSVVVYRALRLLRCAECDQVIAEGELFTRHTVAGHGLRILPKCQKCAPFTLRPEAQGTGPSMIDSLLSAAAGTTPLQEIPPGKKRPSSGSQQDQEERKRIADKMLDRLGPALRRSRRHRS